MRRYLFGIMDGNTMIRIREQGYGIYIVKVYAIVDTVPLFISTLENTDVERLLNGKYSVVVRLEGENKKKLLEKARKIEEILQKNKKKLKEVKNNE